MKKLIVAMIAAMALSVVAFADDAAPKADAGKMEAAPATTTEAAPAAKMDGMAKKGKKAHAKKHSKHAEEAPKTEAPAAKAE